MLTSTAAAAAPDSLEFQAVWDNINHGKALRPTNNKATQINRKQPTNGFRDIQWRSLEDDAMFDMTLIRPLNKG